MSDWKDTVTTLLGKPFVWGGRGPDAFDCWGIVVAALALQGLPVPTDAQDVPPEAGDAGACVAMEQQIQSCPRWCKTDDPQPGDVVAMSTHRRVHHVGLLTPYGVLHTTRGMGARVEPESRLRASGYRRVEYYRWVK